MAAAVSRITITDLLMHFQPLEHTLYIVYSYHPLSMCIHYGATMGNLGFQLISYFGLIIPQIQMLEWSKPIFFLLLWFGDHPCISRPYIISDFDKPILDGYQSEVMKPMWTWWEGTNVGRSSFSFSHVLDSFVANIIGWWWVQSENWQIIDN